MEEVATEVVEAVEVDSPAEAAVEVAAADSPVAEAAEEDTAKKIHRASRDVFFNVLPAYYGGREVCPIALCSITGAQVQGRTLPCPSPVPLWQF